MTNIFYAWGKRVKNIKMQPWKHLSTQISICKPTDKFQYTNSTEYWALLWPTCTKTLLSLLICWSYGFWAFKQFFSAEILHYGFKQSPLESISELESADLKTDTDWCERISACERSWTTTVSTRNVCSEITDTFSN